MSVGPVPVHLRRVAELGIQVGLVAFGVVELGGGDAVRVGFEGVFLDLALGEGREVGVGLAVLTAEEVRDRDEWGFGLVVGNVVVGEASLVEHVALCL